MKRKITCILLIGILAVSLFGCGDAGQQMCGQASGGTMQVVNPIKELTKEALEEQTGIVLHVPESAVDVSYSMIQAGTMTIAQVKYTVNGAGICMRAQVTDIEEVQDISGMYYEWTNVLDAQVGNCEAKVYVRDNVGYIAWRDDTAKVVYNLAMTEDADADTLITLANEVF